MIQIEFTPAELRAATAALTDSSPARMVKEFSGRGGADVLSQVADKAGFPAAAAALAGGRTASMVSAIGKDVVTGFIKQGSARLNKTIDRALGPAGEWFKSIGGADLPPKGDVLLSLGGFMFAVGTAAHQTLQRQCEYRWAQQDRIGRTPAQQFVGEGATRITLDGYTLPLYLRRADPLALLRAMAAEGEPYELVDSLGQPWGRYVATAINETHAELTRIGTPQRIDFTVELLSYGEDED